MNTLFEYQYRDAENYKVWDEVVLAGELKLADLAPYLFDGEYFVPSEVGLADLQEMPFATYDHIWHEIISVSPTSQPATVDISAPKFIESFKSACEKDWSQGEVFKRKGLM